MKQLCRLCKQPVASGSIFCANHKARALAFSMAFGKQPKNTTADDGESGHVNNGGDIERADLDTERSQDPECGDEQDQEQGQEPGEEPVAETDPVRIKIADLLQERYGVIRDRLEKQPEGNRWPLISFYVLGGALHARNYFAIIPSGDESSPQLDLTASCLQNAILPGGVIFEAMAAQIDEHREALTKGEIQTLDLHFLTYAGVVAINGHPKNGKDKNLICFDFDGEGLSETNIDDLRQRLRNKRW